MGCLEKEVGVDHRKRPGWAGPRARIKGNVDASIQPL